VRKTSKFQPLEHQTYKPVLTMAIYAIAVPKYADRKATKSLANELSLVS